jgi:NAD(P)H-dependent flavin oxidoreductase YrpB (nitropropane dioxygenase family)
MSPAPITHYPKIIQGGMGIAVSSWQLAKEVSKAGQIGVISGTAIDGVVSRRLQDGDPTGDIRRAMSHFPDQKVVAQLLEKLFIEGGRDQSKPYIDIPKLTLKPSEFTNNLLVVSSFVEVWLAKENNPGLIGMNILEKIQMAIPAQLYGAMLADVDYILIGAGIPAQIPALLDGLAIGDNVAMRVEVTGATEKHVIEYNPDQISGITYPIKRPHFLAIVSSHILVSYLNKDAETKPDGFVIEGPSAGGHNAPPRAKNHVDENGEAVYGDADVPNFEKILASGSPFWLAGGYGTPDKLKEALALGAKGVQVGSVFALSNESGFLPELRAQVRENLASGNVVVKTDAAASPTGFPFKVIQMNGTVSNQDLYEKRMRICDLGYLRTPYERENGTVGYRCPAEPKDNYEFKKGDSKNYQKSKCLCNALMADIGLPQLRPDGRRELPLVTMGSDLEGPKQLAKIYPNGWSAAQALDYLLN